jgi:hypothetical protein
MSGKNKYYGAMQVAVLAMIGQIQFARDTLERTIADLKEFCIRSIDSSERAHAGTRYNVQLLRYSNCHGADQCQNALRIPFKLKSID